MTERRGKKKRRGRITKQEEVKMRNSMAVEKDFERSFVEKIKKMEW